LEWDANGDGSVDADEFADFWGRLGLNISPIEAQIAIAEMDTNKNGKIEFSELAKVFLLLFGTKIVSNFCYKMMSNKRFKYLKQIAAQNGLNGNDAIRLIRLFEDWDLNSDGKVELKELTMFIEVYLSTFSLQKNKMMSMIKN
jgi:Ca2+-binding EF-hand superfamily protein